MADGVQQSNELSRGRSRCPMKRWPWSFEGVDAVEEEHVEVNVQVERGAETLDQGHCTGIRAGGNGESALLDEEGRDGAVDDRLKSGPPRRLSIGIGLGPRADRQRPGERLRTGRLLCRVRRQLEAPRFPGWSADG